MATFPDILIGSKFDAKGFKQAETAVSKLTKSVKYAAGALGLAFGARAVVNFGKAAVKAFGEDQVAAAKLTNTVKNLGLAFADADIQNFIEKLSLASGVVDDKLRPAMQKLLTTTGSVIKSQELLKKAIDISAGSGVDIQTVAQDLSNAYVGNTKGLKKYALGLTNAELKVASFDTILQAFNKNFQGANAAALDTFAGKMRLLTTAAGEAQETIGSGLVDAFNTLTGDGSFDKFIAKMNSLALSIADFFRGLAIGFRDLANMPVIKQLLELSGIMLKVIGKVAGLVITPFTEAGKESRSKGYGDYASSTDAYMRDKNAKAAAKAEAAAKARAKALIAAQTKNTAELKKQAALKKAQGVFDLQQIQLLAALQGKLTEDEQNRVKALLALQNDNAAAATYYTDLVVKAQDKTGALAQLIRDLPTAKDPFAAWLTSLQQIAASLNSIGSTMNPAYMITPATNIESQYAGNYADAVRGTGAYSPAATTTPSITVQIDGKEIAAVVQNQSLNGNYSTINRSVGNFG